MKYIFVVISAIFFLTSLFSQDITSPTTEQNSEGKIRHYSNNDEYFYIQENYSSVVRASEGIIVQKKYDDLYRLTEEITWENEIIRYIKNNSFDGTSTAIVESVTDDYSLLQRIVEKYLVSGLLQEKKVYVLTPIKIDANSTDTSIKFDEEKTALLYTQGFRYDNDNRLVEKNITYVNKAYNDEKTEYIYSLGEGKPDTYVYINGVLKESIVYSTESDWIETVFFSPTIYIITTYENTNAVREEYFENGIKIRERIK